MATTGGHRTVEFLASAARTANTTDVYGGLEPVEAAMFFLDVTAASGTSPTLNVYIQRTPDGGTTWDDFASFTQRTGAASEVLYWSIHEAITADNQAEKDGTLTAGTLNQGGPMGDQIRIKTVIGGTNTPTFTYKLTGQFHFQAGTP